MNWESEGKGTNRDETYSSSSSVWMDDCVILSNEETEGRKDTEEGEVGTVSSFGTQWRVRCRKQVKHS